MPTIHFEKCPVCESSNINNYLKTKDWGFSGELFQIVKCNACDFAFTQDAPDQESIAKYYHHADYISHTDTANSLLFKIYHLVRKRMLLTKQKWVEKHAAKGKILDIGAGTGYFLQQMKWANWHIEGFEPEKAARDIAKNKLAIDLFDDFEKIVENKNYLDAISMWHVLEHVHDLNQYFEYFNTMLKEDGKVFIAVPNYTATDAQLYKENWAAWDVPKHLWHFSPKALDTLAQKHQFEIEKRYALPFDAFYIALLSEKTFIGKIRAVFVGIYAFLSTKINIEKASSIAYVLKRKKAN